MEERDIYSGVAATLTEKPVYKFSVAVDWQMPLSRWSVVDWVMKKLGKVRPEVDRQFEIKPCKVGNFHRVAGRAVLLPDQFFSGDDMDAAIIPLLTEYRNDLTYIIASAIQNNCEEPGRLLVKFIQKNFDNIDIYHGLKASLDGLEMQSFLNSIVLVKGTETILKPRTSPKDGSELIASHTALLDQSANTLAGQKSTPYGN